MTSKDGDFTVSFLFAKNSLTFMKKLKTKLPKPKGMVEAWSAVLGD